MRKKFLRFADARFDYINIHSDKAAHTGFFY